MDGVGGCGCRLVWGRRGKAQVRELGRGQGNFKLAANFGYNSRGSADPRESLRKRRILKLALTAHKVSCHPGSAFLLRPYRNKQKKKPTLKNKRSTSKFRFLNTYDSAPTCFLIASKLSLLITCSILQASSVAISSGTPRCISQEESSSCRS